MCKRIFHLLPYLSIFILIAFSGCDGGSKKDYDDTIVCLGNSLTAGYGTGSEPPSYMDQSKAYPARLEEKLNCGVINSGISGITTEKALGRLNSVGLEYDPVIVVIELGANDLFEEVDIAVTENNLQSIIDYVDNGERKIYLAKFYTEAVGRSFLEDQGITDFDEQTTLITSYDTMFSTLEADNNDIELIEDIWTGVWGIPEHMYSDGIHPDASGYAIMADNYFAVMEPYLESQGYIK